ncbi:lasso peptide biosynthesis B2 protein [Oceanobacillus chungangensis]|uniref:Stage V sporulation protein S n=1 Tax=Oceanobacillus chungangensis TaxID=1229152 RepID=A0A3D8PYQ7_9BACI|nr:lasso peptide biosynthesis B2 protein [Oceanobacillus chungangensis]RDW20418.1 stage V sporulation protein S [Oceanobacillus chungangensis]
MENHLNKLKTFLSFNRQTKMLLFESYIYLGFARILKGLPFSRVAPTLGDQMTETAYTSHSLDRETLSRIKQAIHIMSRYTFWESQCLVKAIAAMKMLERRQIESTLYLGTAKDEKGKFIAHAWLRSGPFYVTGSEVMERFTVVNKFAKRI